MFKRQMWGCENQRGNTQPTQEDREGLGAGGGWAGPTGTGLSWRALPEEPWPHSEACVCTAQLNPGQAQAEKSGPQAGARASLGTPLLEGLGLGALPVPRSLVSFLFAPGPSCRERTERASSGVSNPGMEMGLPSEGDEREGAGGQRTESPPLPGVTGLQQKPQEVPRHREKQPGLVRSV